MRSWEIFAAGREKELRKLFVTLPPFLRVHSRQVAWYARLLAETLWDERACSFWGMDREEFAGNLERAAFWHDIGKVKISNAIWELAGPLTKEEYTLVKAHVILGAALIEDKVKPPASPGSDICGLVRDGCLFHHERWDGLGYPFGFSGRRIPAAVRIISIADAFDCMTAERPYKRAMTVPQAISEIRQCAGAQFDPDFSESFCRIIERGKGVIQSVEGSFQNAEGSSR